MNRNKNKETDPGFGRNSWISLQNDPVLHGCVAITPWFIWSYFFSILTINPDFQTKELKNYKLE